MKDMTGPRQTTCLMHGMAEKLGVDLEAAQNDGRLPDAELGDMIVRCGECHAHDACILWMLEHENDATDPPEYCLNTQEMQFLRASAGT